MIEIAVNVIIWVTMVVGILLFIVAMIGNNNNQEKLVRAQRQTNDLLADIVNSLIEDHNEDEDEIPNRELEAPTYDKVTDYVYPRMRRR